jgi:sulfur-carrier protein
MSSAGPRDERCAVPAEIRLPTVLRAQADGQATVTVDGATVGEAFNGLITSYPGLRANLLDGAGGLHKFVNVYINDEDIRYLDGLDTKIGDGDVISILPAVAGGAASLRARPEVWAASLRARPEVWAASLRARPEV